MSDEVVRSYWASAYWSDGFVCIKTNSGYAGGRGDPKGKQHLLPPDADDETLGTALLDALSHSRFVLAAPREGSTYPPDLEFDRELYDYLLTSERYAAWIKSLMDRYGYKTKRALFKNMELCNVEVTAGVMQIVPMRHVKLEMWEGISPGDSTAVTLPADSSPAQAGAALRLAFSRCTE